MTIGEAFSKENNVGKNVLEFPLTARIGFNGNDETEFDAETYGELVECWEDFCKENPDINLDSIDWIEALDYRYDDDEDGMRCDEYDLKETKFGTIFCDVFEENIVIRFKANCGVIVDLFSIQIEDNCLKENLYGSVFDPYPTSNATIKNSAIISSMYD